MSIRFTVAEKFFELVLSEMDQISGNQKVKKISLSFNELDNLVSILVCLDKNLMADEDEPYIQVFDIDPLVIKAIGVNLVYLAKQLMDKK
jgi:hypothetical protein